MYSFIYHLYTFVIMNTLHHGEWTHRHMCLISCHLPISLPLFSILSPLPFPLHKVYSFLSSACLSLCKVCFIVSYTLSFILLFNLFTVWVSHTREILWYLIFCSSLILCDLLDFCRWQDFSILLYGWCISHALHLYFCGWACRDRIGDPETAPWSFSHQIFRKGAKKLWWRRQHLGQIWLVIKVQKNGRTMSLALY